MKKIPISGQSECNGNIPDEAALKREFRHKLGRLRTFRKSWEEIHQRLLAGDMSCLDDAVAVDEFDPILDTDLAYALVASEAESAEYSELLRLCREYADKINRQLSDLFDDDDLVARKQAVAV